MTLAELDTYLCALPGRCALMLGEVRTYTALATLQRLSRAVRRAERAYLAACAPHVPYGTYCDALTDWQCARAVFEEYLLSGRDLSQESAAYEIASAFEREAGQ